MQQSGLRIYSERVKLKIPVSYYFQGPPCKPLFRVMGLGPGRVSLSSGWPR